MSQLSLTTPMNVSVPLKLCLVFLKSAGNCLWVSSSKISSCWPSAVLMASGRGKYGTCLYCENDFGPFGLVFPETFIMSLNNAFLNNLFVLLRNRQPKHQLNANSGKNISESEYLNDISYILYAKFTSCKIPSPSRTILQQRQDVVPLQDPLRVQSQCRKSAFRHFEFQ